MLWAWLLAASCLTLTVPIRGAPQGARPAVTDYQLLFALSPRAFPSGVSASRRAFQE